MVIDLTWLVWVSRRGLAAAAVLVFAGLACGHSGSGSDGGTRAFVCPDAKPTAQGTCEQPGASCVYMQCDAFGMATATCRDDGRWEVATDACGQLECAGQTCDPGSVCSIHEAGAIEGQCLADPCGDGPIDCACLGCPEDRCSQDGATITCNTCYATVCG